MIPQGQALYLKPYYDTSLDKRGDGLYVKSGKRFVDVRGLLLGENNPVSKATGNLPIIGKYWKQYCE